MLTDSPCSCLPDSFPPRTRLSPGASCTMAGETQRPYAIKDLDVQDVGSPLEQQSDRHARAPSEHFPSTGTDSVGRGASREKLEKERDATQQREAVIRPQQAGKIDFSSLQNRATFATDRTWSNGKRSPQSPSGKSRGREKGKRSGKSERGSPQQLYRLSIANPRSNPNIGIAYPQQKVSPPKKQEAGRGPVTGSYRFHVPSVPEREAELQQEELSYSRCFQEPSNLTSPSYTSQALGSAGGTAPQQPALSQQPASMESSGAQPGSQLLLTDFQLSGSNAWQSPEHIFNGANYGLSSQKTTALTEAGKPNAFVPVQFQFGYQFLEDSTSDTYSGEQNPQTQDFADSSLGSVHVNHTSFGFTSCEGQEGAQSNAQYSSDQLSEDRTSYPQHPQPSQYIPTPQGAASSMHCLRTLSEDSASSDSSGSSSQQSDQGKSALPESTEAFGQVDNINSKKSCHTKETAANQRTIIQGNVHHSRNIAQGSNSQMHFPNKTYHSSPHSTIHVGSVPFEKNIKVHNRGPHCWEGSSKTYSTVDQNAIPYTDMNDKFHFQNQQSLDQRPNSSKNSQISWQQLRLTSALPSQNKVELSRPLSNQKQTYMVSPSDWQDDNVKSQKNAPLKSLSALQNNRPSDGFPTQRQETVKHSSKTISSFKVEMSHAHVCESKNKPVYFGMNQSLPGASSRNYNYQPLQVPPIGLMMVSPYESPSPSPLHNPTSSSTCSSLSPTSTSPVNLSSEEGQMPKAPFYHQQQAKAQLVVDHLNTNPHHFHSDGPGHSPYAPDRAKDDTLSYLQSNGHPKMSMDGNKCYMDSLSVDHHQPPPSYSAHQLLASSLATANLDQLDVLLTCKQCDQNFNNVASFLGHKQYCAQHSFAQNDLKDLSKMEDNRKFPAELTKASLSGPSCLSMSRCPSDLHLSLLGLNKNGELMSDSEAKGDAKEDPMKLNMFSGPGILPVPLPDLEMDGLDSLITEALNGLGYQSDNADIDSSFIDAFADDDLATVKQSLKTKESMVFESKSKVASDDDRSLVQGKYIYDSDLGSPKTAKHFTDRKSEKISLNLIKGEKINIKKDVTHKNPRFASGEKSRQQDVKVRETRKLCKPEDENTGSSRFCLSTNFSEHCGVKSLPDNSTLTVTTPAQVSNTNQTSPTIRTPFKENKRKRTGGGSWSKELIHKIVQQKNKLHKLHVKGTKNLQFSLVMERLTPTVQNPAFGEYDYVSDSDDECEPVKIASQGRLSQSSRCKYTYTKECKWRARSERDQAAWRHESKECFAVKKSEEVSLSPEKPGSHQRLGRRGSRSSTSSELSTSVSISGDSINSPKSTDHTDSDCEKRMEIKRKESPEPRTYDRPSSQKMSTQLALTFTKSTKKYNADKHTLSTSKEKTTKGYHSNSEDADHASSPPKAKGAIKNLDKCRTTHRTSREKLELFSQEIGTLSSTGINSSHAIDNTSSKEESLQSAISNIKKPHLDNESVFASKVTDSPTKNVRNSKGKLMLKRNAQAEGQPSQTHFSEIAALEKQTDGVSLVKEAVCLIPNIPMCNSLIEEVCLSPTATDGQLLQKDPSHLIPFPLDQEQGLMKSPLSFDASSVFGDLTVAGFGSGLYSDMSLQKEGFNTDNTTDKKEGFVSSFSPFLEQREWSLMDVSTVLPDEIAQYKGNSEKSNEKKPDFNHVPLSLPEKIMDYSTNLNSCAEDELEIKRIVNELENQLQKTKLQNSPLLAEEAPQQLQMSKFSPLRLGDESENEGNSVDIVYPVQAIEITDVAEHFTEPTLPWSSPFQFELMAEHHSPQSPTHHHPGIPEQFPEKDDNTANTESAVTCEAHLEQNPEEIHVEKGAPTETKEDMLEQKRYAEDIMKSLEVISDSIFEKQSIISEQEVNVTNLETQQHLEIERQSTDAVVRAVGGKEEGINKENIPLPPNINEGKDDITLILIESQPPLSNSTELTVDAKQPIILHLSEHEENNHQAETKVTSLEDNITDNVNGSAFCLNMEMDVLHMAEVNGGNAHIEDNINVQFTNNTDVLQHSTTISAHEEEVNAITSQQESRHSPPTPPKTTLEKGNHMDMVQPGWIEYPAYIHNNAEDVCSSLADKRKEDSSANIIKEGENPVGTLKQEGLIEYAAPQQYSALETYCTSQTSGMEVVATELPCSPILMEPDMDCTTLSFQRAHAAVGESSRLTSSQSTDILQFGVGTACLFKNKCESKMGLAPDIHHNQETDIPDVKNIGEQPPVNLIASCQSSPCGNVMDLEESNNFILNAVPQNSPPHSPIEKLVIQNNPFHSQSKSTDITFSQTSLINALSSPRNDHQNVNEALHIDEPLSTEITYSLISPPQQDLGITDCKSQSTANVSSPLPMASIAAEQPETSESFPKKDTLNCFKLSPLNYSGISNDPPQLSQYDYIPISPAYKAEEKSDIKQTSSNVSDPCDLSVDPGLIFNHNRMVGDKYKHPFNSIVPAKHSLPDEPMKMSSIEESPKFALAFQSQEESTDNLTVSYKNDLEACHNPPEAIEYFNMTDDLLKTVEKENGGVSEDTFLPDSALFRRDIPDCENKQMSLPSAAMGKTPIEISQSSTANQVQEEILPKKSAQHSSQQGKALCEICSMCFRTVPGLKRHKAMKHLVRTGIQTVQENATSTHQGTVPIYDASQTTEKGNKDESQAGFQRQLNRMAESRCVEKRKETLTNKSSEIKSVLDNVRQTETLIPSAVVDAGNYPPPLQTKAKKNKKSRNNKNTNVNIKPDNFSDEILNVLKTDILQAITPEFQNCGAQKQCNSPEGKEKIHLNKNITDAEHLPIIDASKNDIEQVTTSLLKETNVSREVMVFKQNNLDSKELKCMAEMGSGEDICADASKDCVLSKNEDTSGECNELNNKLYAGEVMLEEKECLTKEMLRNMSVEIKCANKNGQPDIVNHSPLSPPGMSPDLKALLDDDTTFSQLFPRDEEIKRKKCQRVYSKKNKRQKLSSDPHLDQDLSPAKVLLPNKEQYSEKQGDDKLSNNKSNHCEYDTISIDDAIMLNMCHNSTLNSDANVISGIKQGANDHEDINENEELSSIVLSPIENNVDKSSITRSGSCEPSSFIVDAVGTAVPSSCKTEVPPPPCPLPLTSTPYSVEPCVSDNVTNFHSIDIQNINTTFQLPEIQFFDSSKDITVAPPISSVDTENKDVEKSKKQSEHRGRKRQDGSMKAKDKQYKCKVCFTWFLTLGELNFHKLSHNPSPPPTCYMCVQRKFSSREQLRDHLREKHAKNKAGIWTCGMCLKEISDVWMYNEHLREHATQFARKGQTQGSMLGIPGSLMQETAVKNFITSIMQHRPSKTIRESSKTSKEQEKLETTAGTSGEGKTTEVSSPKGNKTKSSNGTSGKQGRLPPLEILHKTETPKNVEIHPNCKDPSRDCHHCGKQFPKPFKLQRHLVVHNLEKIFLCNKCPVSYQEAQELKDHLKRVHEEVDELDSKHTTLYTCELCADVMHVIKKSFICSTCNYTFSKKEQFDRHMEKHLSGGNKIFKFRSVLRPVKAPISKEECDFPASKKRRILNDSLQDNSSDSGIASIGSLHLSHNPEMTSKPSVSTADDSTQTSANEYYNDAQSANVKTENIAEEYSDLLVELEQCAFNIGSSEATTPKKEEKDLNPSLKKPEKEDYVKSVTETCVKKEDETVCIRLQTTTQCSFSKVNTKVGEEKVKGKPGSECSTGEQENRSEKMPVVPPNGESLSNIIENQMTKTLGSEKLKLDAGVIEKQGQNSTPNKSNTIRQDTLTNSAEKQGSCQLKDKLPPSKTIDGTKSSMTRATDPPLISKSSIHSSVLVEDRVSLKLQKKMKDVKASHSLPRGPYPETRENLCTDPRVNKKFRAGICPSLQRKSDGPCEYPVLSSVRDEVVSSTIVTKYKTKNLGMPPKRRLLDNYTPKKAEIVTQINVDYNSKKGSLGRPLHSPVSKVSTPMNNSLNKSRTNMGVRSMERHSYRTAESQNNLLSQLFGQKLTSFKIPLRKDTSESIN